MSLSSAEKMHQMASCPCRFWLGHGYAAGLRPHEHALDCPLYVDQQQWANPPPALPYTGICEYEWVKVYKYRAPGLLTEGQPYVEGAVYIEYEMRRKDD